MANAAQNQQRTEKVCQICGRVFPGIKTALYCSYRCKVEAQMILRYEREHRPLFEAKNNQVIAAVAKQADAAGLSYGQYVLRTEPPVKRKTGKRNARAQQKARS